MTPPTNCACTWTHRATTGWARIRHTTGCPVHGADHQPPTSEGTSHAILEFDFPQGMTAQDVLDLAVAIIDAHTAPTARITTRAGWNTTRRINVDPGNPLV